MKQKELTVCEAAAKRRATRAFQSKLIPEKILQKIVGVIRMAPSSFNLQPVRLVVIQDPKQKEALSAAAWNQKQIIDAPATFVFAVSIRGWEKNLEKMISIASESGVWDEKRIEYVRKSAPAFQNNLGDKEREYAVKDAMIAATHAALAAESLGLASCFMNGWIENDVKKVIGAEGNSDIAIAVLLPIGYPQSTPLNPGRLPQIKTVFADRLK
ncbi:MAG: nitroreductase family protein [Verrucomicrobiota bacterium]